MWDVPINVIREQWTTVTDHLTLSAALIVFGFFLGWSFCWLYFRQQLNVSKDRIEHYKERLGEITPAERLKRQKIREALGELMVEGQGILRLYRNLSSVQPEQQEAELATITKHAEVWFDKVTKYLRDNLDSSYAARVANGAGLSALPYMISYSTYQTLVNDVVIRITRLQEFIGELSTD